MKTNHTLHACKHLHLRSSLNSLTHESLRNRIAAHRQLHLAPTRPGDITGVVMSSASGPFSGTCQTPPPKVDT